jgi:hypothetical protein
MDHDPVPWLPGGSSEMDEELVRSFESRTLEDFHELVNWTCPRCHARQSESLERNGYWAGLEPSDNPPIDLPVKCDCGLEHEGRPPGEIGCGYRRVLILDSEEE